MKKIRCPYFELNDLERAYHDKEWGTPCRNDRRLFEYLMYEVLQCGLSWDTIIQKRAAFRVAFERFDFEKIARYGERDIARILAVPGMIRSRRKIDAIIHDAQRFIALRRECGTFDWFGLESHPDYKDITKEQFANRMLLREIMLAHGFKPIAEEWWHLTLKNEPYPDTYFDFPVR